VEHRQVDADADAHEAEQQTEDCPARWPHGAMIA
jgi:hypothetical protein